MAMSVLCVCTYVHVHVYVCMHFMIIVPLSVPQSAQFGNRSTCYSSLCAIALAEFETELKCMEINALLSLTFSLQLIIQQAPLWLRDGVT